MDFSYKNLLIGAAIQVSTHPLTKVFEVSTLGQPFEVLKTQQAANASQSLPTAIKTIYSQAGVGGFWRGLWPWAIIEASTKGTDVLMKAQSYFSCRLKLNLFLVNTLGLGRRELGSSVGWYLGR